MLVLLDSPAQPTEKVTSVARQFSSSLADGGTSVELTSFVAVPGLELVLCAFHTS